MPVTIYHGVKDWHGGTSAFTTIWGRATKLSVMRTWPGSLPQEERPDAEAKVIEDAKNFWIAAGLR
jgi:hypothetical protein